MNRQSILSTRKWKMTHVATGKGARLREGLLAKISTALTVRADADYRSKANEDFMEKSGFVEKVPRKKLHFNSMLRHIQRSHAEKAAIFSK